MIKKQEMLLRIKIFNVKGILGIIKELYENNIISKEEAIRYLDKLPREGFWIDNKILEKIKNEILYK